MTVFMLRLSKLYVALRLLFLSAMFVMGWAGGSTFGATVTVTSSTESDGVSLRQALTDANAGDTITFDTTSMGGSTVTLASGELTVTKQLTIDGDLNNDGTPDITISAGNSSRVFNVSGGGSGTEVMFDGLIIRDGVLAGNGGDGAQSGDSSGAAGGSGLGAGIYNSGFLIVNNSQISDNRASGGGGGGGKGFGFSQGGGGGGAGVSGIGGSGGTGHDLFNPNSGDGPSGATGGKGGNFSSFYDQFTGYGGSTSGGSGGATSNGNDFGAGGSGGTARINGVNIIGGGGASSGSGPANGGKGGDGVGGIYNSGTMTLNNTSILRNAGAGGGGGGSGLDGGTSGDGGIGVGGIYNADGSTLNYNNTVVFGTGATENGGAGGARGSATTNGTSGASARDILNHSNATVSLIVSFSNTTLSYTEDGPTTYIDSSAISNGANGAVDWNGGTMVLQITANNEAADVITLPTGTDSGINVDGSGNLRNNTTTIGTVSPSAGYATNGNTLTLTFNSSASDSLAQSALRAVSYRTTSDTPGTSNRTVSLTATDKNGLTSSDTRTISVSAANDTPKLVFTNGSVSYTEQASAIVIDSTSALFDPEGDSEWDGGKLTAQITANAAASDEILLPTGTSTGINVDGSGNLRNNTTTIGTVSPTSGSVTGGNTITITFNNAATNALAQSTLRAFQFRNLTDNPGSSVRTVTFTGTDKNNGSRSGTRAIAITEVNDTPLLSLNNSNTSYTENASAIQIDAAGTVSDPDGDAEWTGGALTAQITANYIASDLISISDADGSNPAITISGSNIYADSADIGNLSHAEGQVYANSVLTVTFEAGVTNAIVQEVLQSIRFHNTSHDPGNAVRTLTITAADNNSAAASATRAIAVVPVNDAPFIAFPNLQADYIHYSTGSSAILIGATATTPDLDNANWGGGSLAAQVSANAETGDELSINDTDNAAPAITITGTKIYADSVDVGDLSASGGVVTGNATLTISFNASADNTIANEVLQSLRYRSTAISPGTATRTVTVTATDQPGDSRSGSVNIPVTIINVAPTAVNDATSTNEDTPLTVPVTGLTQNDTDPDNNPLEVTGVSDSVNGSVSFATPLITFTPDQDFNGAASFIYTISDGIAAVSATVNVTVNPVNDAPIPNNATAAVMEQVGGVIKLSGSDIDGDTLTYELLTNPKRGVVSNFNAVAGTLTYVPDNSLTNQDYIGIDSFTFRVSDGSLQSGAATVTINVLNENDPPVAHNLSVTVAPGSLSAIILKASDKDQDSLFFTILNGPSNGTVSYFDFSLGRIDYQPNNGFTGVDSITFTATDGNLTSAPATLTINVQAPPTATPTLSPTNTATNTATPTATNTLAPTNTPTPTATATNTPNPDHSPTPTSTNTATPTATETATPTSTSTNTATNTPVPTNTPRPGNTAPQVVAIKSLSGPVMIHSEVLISLYIIESEQDPIELILSDGAPILSSNITSVPSITIADFRLDTSKAGIFPFTVTAYDGNVANTLELVLTVIDPNSTPTATNTAIPTATNTLTPTATNTATNTPTHTATNVPTSTLTPTATSTNSPTQTPIPPTFSPTNTPTVTPTPTQAPPAGQLLGSADNAGAADVITGGIDFDTMTRRGLSIRWQIDSAGIKEYHVYVRSNAASSFTYLGKTLDANTNVLNWSIGSQDITAHFRTGPQYHTDYQFIVYAVNQTPPPNDFGPYTEQGAIAYRPNTPLNTELLDYPFGTIRILPSVTVTDDAVTADDLSNGQDTDALNDQALAVRWTFDDLTLPQGISIIDYHVYTAVGGNANLQYVGRVGNGAADLFEWREEQGILTTAFRAGPQPGVSYRFAVYPITSERDENNRFVKLGPFLTEGPVLYGP